MLFKVRIKGVAPLIVHNVRLSDPLDDFARKLKKVSSKKRKTDEDHELMSKIEFFGGLYVDADNHPIIPAANLEALIVEGARKKRLGKQAGAGVWVEEDARIIYSGPRDADALFKSGRFLLRRPVRVGPSRIMRTRPIFYAWELEFFANIEPTVMDPEQVHAALVDAGRLVGLGTWKPRHGRFEVEIFEEVRQAKVA